MKTQTKKLVLTAKGTISKNISNAINNCILYRNKVYPVSYSGSGNFVSKKDFSETIIQLLNAQSYKFEKGNDAPRGGENGNYFKVSNTAITFLKSLK